MKFPKLPKIFKKNLFVVYVIIFLLIASVLVFYFYGSFREGACTDGPTCLTDASDNYNDILSITGITIESNRIVSM
jgi:hypothetical protein